MREILFKAKRIDNGEWVIGSLLAYPDGDCFICCCNFDPNCLNKYEVDSATLCQYTGLNDKNGVKIWEGDICKDNLGWVFEVTWDEKNGRFLGRHSKPRGETYICYVGKIPAVEIIGNIFDNLGLLKVVESVLDEHY